MNNRQTPKAIVRSVLLGIFSLAGTCSYASSVPVNVMLQAKDSLSQEMTKRNGALKVLYLAPTDGGYFAISKDDKLSCIAKVSAVAPHAYQGPVKCSSDAREFKTISEVEYQAKDAKWQAFTFK